MTPENYMEFVRSRITELRLRKDVSEHKMSLDLDRSGSYIRGITSGRAMPSMKELFRIMEYLNITPDQFFEPLADEDTPYGRLCQRLRESDESRIEKVLQFLDMLEN